MIRHLHEQAAHQNNWANWDKNKTSHPKSEVTSQFIKRHQTYPYILWFSSVFLSLGHMCRAQKLFKSRAIQSAIACREVLDGSSAVFAWEEMESSTESSCISDSILLEIGSRWLWSSCAWCHYGLAQNTRKHMNKMYQSSKMEISKTKKSLPGCLQLQVEVCQMPREYWTVFCRLCYSRTNKDVVCTYQYIVEGETASERDTWKWKHHSAYNDPFAKTFLSQKIRNELPFFIWTEGPKKKHQCRYLAYLIVYPIYPAVPSTQVPCRPHPECHVGWGDLHGLESMMSAQIRSSHPMPHRGPIQGSKIRGPGPWQRYWLPCSIAIEPYCCMHPHSSRNMCWV